jgi:electron transport complex protein RnfE
VVDGLAMGLGFTAVLFVLGSMRELIGQGTWLDGIHMMFGDAARPLTVNLGDDFPGLLIAILPPGAFIGLGVLIALKNLIDARAARLAAARPPAAEAESVTT